MSAKKCKPCRKYPKPGRKTVPVKPHRRSKPGPCPSKPARRQRPPKRGGKR